MKCSIISLFPEILQNYFNYGVIGRAIDNQLVEVEYYNPRAYTSCKHGSVDDKPYGGGAGMLLRPEPLARAIDTALAGDDAGIKPKVIYFSPQGQVLDQKKVKSLVHDLINNKQNLVLLSGRYQGIDQRIIDEYVDEQISIGDYVLSGGELPSLVLLEAMIRLLPGVLGNENSIEQETFSPLTTNSDSKLLEYPQYTRPEEYLGKKVPEVLLSGDHVKIARWRRKQMLGKTWLYRPNLLKYVDLTLDEQQLLSEFKQELNKTRI